jgi:hypothetical protein
MRTGMRTSSRQPCRSGQISVYVGFRQVRADALPSESFIDHYERRCAVRSEGDLVALDHSPVPDGGGEAG